MASNPPGQCCIVGVKHEGDAKGEIKDIDGISTYFAYPEDGKTDHAILLLSDFFGHRFINTQLIADQFAANGYLVVVPDLFAGDSVPLDMPSDFNVMKWATTGRGGKGHMPNEVDPIVSKIVCQIRSDLGVKKLGAVGYCYGAKYVARFSAGGKDVDAGCMAHPSFVDAKEIKAVAVPLSIAAAETDEIFPAAKRRETEDILKEMEIQYQMSLYSDVEHGFAVRADMSNPRVKFAKEAAFVQHVQWFNEHLKGGKYSAQV